MSVAVLMYHHILKKSGFIASSESEFRSQMSYLAKQGWHTLSLDEFARYKKGEFVPPKKSVLISFDDGWRDNFVYAYPILREFNLKACIFLVTGWIEAASEQKAKLGDVKPALLEHSKAKALASAQPAGLFLNWDEIEQMKHNGIDFASHTHGHSDGYFDKLSWSDELGKCQEIMYKRLGIKDKHLCWPRGRYDAQKLAMAKEFGYEFFYTTKRGINRPDGALDDIRRIAAKGSQNWLRKSLFIYSNDILGGLYSWIKG